MAILTRALNLAILTADFHVTFLKIAFRDVRN